MTQSFAKSAFLLKITSMFEIGMAACSSSIVSPSSSQNFTEGVLYALSQLQMSHLTLKDQRFMPFTAEKMFSFFADWFR